MAQTQPPAEPRTQRVPPRFAPYPGNRGQAADEEGCRCATPYGPLPSRMAASTSEGAAAHLRNQLDPGETLAETARPLAGQEVGDLGKGVQLVLVHSL